MQLALDEKPQQRIELRDYQEEAIQKTLEAQERGVLNQLGVAATGLGKGLEVGTPVLTPGGWVPVESLAEGDSVVGANGFPTLVEAVFDRGVQPAYVVTTDDGVKLTVDRDHLWTVATDYDLNRNRPWRTLDTQALCKTGTASPNGRLRWRLPLAAPIENSNKELPIDPYVLGVLIADGSLEGKTPRFCPGDEEIAVEVKNRLTDGLSLTLYQFPEPSSAYSITDSLSWGRGHGPNRMTTALKNIGLHGHGALTKRIPPEYFQGSVAQRWDLLRGLMDCDGWAGSAVQYCTSSAGLAEDVVALVQSLGGVARISTKAKPAYTYRGERRIGQPAHAVTFRTSECPFALKRKVSAWSAKKRLHPTRKIASIAPVGEAHTICIKVAGRDGLFVTKGHVVTHNTIIFVALAEKLGKRTLVLAHRDELINQAAEKIRAYTNVDVGILKAQRAELDAQIVVASVQTASRGKRLEKLAENPFDFVIVDEAHHSAAPSYRKILDGLHHDARLLLGVTATPDRGDGRGLDDVFQEIVWNYDMLWGIRSGYLSDIQGKRVSLQSFDLSQVKIKQGEYDQGQAGAMLEEAGAPDFLARSYMEYASGRRSIVFVPTVAMALATERAFARYGLKVTEVDGGTPLEERRDRLAAFSRGEVDVAVNVGVLTEGYDNPRVDCIMVARPTRSRATYTQIIGRGTRRHPEKDHLLVLDLVGATEQHSLVTIPSLFGLRDVKEWESSGRPLTAQLTEQDETDVRAGRLKAQDVEMFKAMQSQGIAWVQASLDDLKRYVRTMGKGKDGEPLPTVWIQQTQKDPEVWSSGLLNEQTGEVRNLLTDTNLEMAQGVAEDYLRKQGSKLVRLDAPWRKRPPTEKQLIAAAKWRLPQPEQHKTAGELSEALDLHIQRTKERQKRKPAREPMNHVGRPS